MVSPTITGIATHIPYHFAFRVENILNGTSEAEKVLHRDPSPEYGYLMLPDMKWDLNTLSSLYLVAIAFNRNIHSLRDLNKTHLGMLKSIRREAARVVKERWGLDQGSLRMFIHYQPSYCQSRLQLTRWTGVDSSLQITSMFTS